MEAAAASSVGGLGAGFGPGLGLVRSSAGRLRPPPCLPRPPRPASRLVCNRGAKTWSIVAAAAADSSHQHEESLGLAMEPQRSSPQEVVASPTFLVLVQSSSPFVRKSL